MTFRNSLRKTFADAALNPVGQFTLKLAPLLTFLASMISNYGLYQHYPRPAKTFTIGDTGWALNYLNKWFNKPDEQENENLLPNLSSLMPLQKGLAVAGWLGKPVSGVGGLIGSGLFVHDAIMGGDNPFIVVLTNLPGMLESTVEISERILHRLSRKAEKSDKKPFRLVG